MLLLCVGSQTLCQAQELTEEDKKPAQALQQEVSAALAAHCPLKADLTWIRSYEDYPPPPVLDPASGTDDNSGPCERRIKRPLVVIHQTLKMPPGAAIALPGSTDQFVSTRGKSYNEELSDLLRHLGDPFIPYFRDGLARPHDPAIYVGGLHYAGTETKNGAVYRVLEAHIVIVSSAATAPQEASSKGSAEAGIIVPKARFTVTDWRWDIGSDHLIHRFTWDNHEDESVTRSVEKNEIIVNKSYFP